MALDQCEFLAGQFAQFVLDHLRTGAQAAFEQAGHFAGSGFLCNSLATFPGRHSFPPDRGRAVPMSLARRQCRLAIYNAML
jgi:hypothetical protein